MSLPANMYKIDSHVDMYDFAPNPLLRAPASLVPLLWDRECKSGMTYQALKFSHKRIAQ